MKPLIIDIETAPIKLDEYLTKTTELERKKYLNPIDSRIVAMGLRYEGKSHIGYLGPWPQTDIDTLKYSACESEADMLRKFWKLWTDTLYPKKEDTFTIRPKIVGYNVHEFDIPFIVSRSFIHGVKIEAFKVKEIVDIRDKLSAFRYGPVRGKMKEYAQLIGLPVVDEDGGSKVAEWVHAGEWKKLCEYLACDLEITDKLYQRCVDTNIDQIEKW